MAQPHEMATLVQRGSTRTSAHTRGAAAVGRRGPQARAVPPAGRPGPPPERSPQGRIAGEGTGAPGPPPTASEMAPGGPGRGFDPRIRPIPRPGGPQRARAGSERSAPRRAPRAGLPRSPDRGPPGPAPPSQGGRRRGPHRPNPANRPPDRADPRPNRDKCNSHPQLVIFSCQCSSP